MKCPTCSNENLIGAAYCASCGERLEVTDLQARVETLAEVTEAKWARIYKALGRSIGIISCALVAVFLFRAYSTREIGYDFTPSVPLTSPPELTFYQPPIKQALMPAPIAQAGQELAAESDDVAGIISSITGPARERLYCSLSLKSGGIVRGLLWGRTDTEIVLVLDWGPPVRTKTLKLDEVDLEHSRLPQ